MEHVKRSPGHGFPIDIYYFLFVLHETLAQPQPEMFFGHVHNLGTCFYGPTAQAREIFDSRGNPTVEAGFLFFFRLSSRRFSEGLPQTWIVKPLQDRGVYDLHQESVSLVSCLRAL